MKGVYFFLLVICGLISTNVIAQHDEGDTVLVKRAMYFGFFAGRLQFMEAEHFLYDQPHGMSLGPEVIKVQVGNAIQGGIFFTYPFLYKMEWDAGFGVFGFQRQTIWQDVSAISTTSPSSIISSSTWIDKKNLTVTEVRSHFSYNIIQRANFSLLIGAGGWLASNSMKAAFNPGSVGMEGNVTAYYLFNKKSFVQIHLSPGYMRNGYYLNMTLGICYQGQRTMRVHPKKYYVRTYELEE